MEVNKPGTVAPSGEDRGDGTAAFAGDGRGKGDDAAADEGAVNGGRAAIDPVTILNIPTNELTPAVELAISRLSTEMERLRQAMVQGRSRIAYLETLADRHPFLPVLNRRAFARELAKVLTHAGLLGTPASLLCLHLASAEDIRRRWGRKALDQGLTQVCEIVGAALHPTDIMGNLGGADFGVVLLLADRQAALAKGAALVEAVGARSLPVGDVQITLKLAWGARVLMAGDEIEVVLEAAERQLMEMATAADGLAPAP